MPRYDFGCSSGHITEQVVDRDIRSATCDCGASAERLLSLGVSVGGMRTPTQYHDINLNRAVEAHGETLLAAERAGVEPPDTLGEAKRRVAAGEVRAIA